MQNTNKNRVYDKDLRRFIYPQIPKTLSYTSNYNPQQSYLNYQYTNTPSYLANRELNRNALGYPRDEGQLSGCLNNNNKYPYKYMKNTYKPESKIYHYSIASKREYNQDKEEDTSSGRPQQQDLIQKKYNHLSLDKKTYSIDSNNKFKRFLNRKKEENILPTKVFTSDTYQYNKENPYKSRPSREKDGYKGGVINLKQNNKYNNNEYLRNIILIQKWWKKYLNNKIRYKSASRNNSINENDINYKSINNKGNKFIVQTTRVEVFKRPYMNIPLIKPEIITKENKINLGRKVDEENLEIILDKDSLKQNMVNIWNEDNVFDSASNLCIIQNENFNRENLIRNNKIRKYEEEIRQLQLALSLKEEELNNLSNILKSIQNKKALNEKSITRQLVDNLFINNHRTIMNISSIEMNENFEILPIEKEPLQKQLIDILFIPKNLDFYSKNIQYSFSLDKTIIEARDNLVIMPIEKEPLKKQFVDNIFIEETNIIKQQNEIQNTNKLTILKTIKPQNSIESNESIEIFPIEKDPLQMQFIDTLFIKKIKRENQIQKTEKLSLFKKQKPQNIFESIDNIEISYLEEEKTLEKQTVDDLFIPRKLKPISQIQKIDKLTIFKTKRPNNIIRTEYYFELLPQEKDPLQAQFIDDFYIQKIIKPENISQNIDKIYIYEIPKATNFIQSRDIIELSSIENEPLQIQLIDDLFIEKTPYSFKNLMMEGFEGITVLKKEKNHLYNQGIDSFVIDSLEVKDNSIQNTCLMTILKNQKPESIIETSDSIFIPQKEKSPLEMQLIDKLIIEENKKPENKVQNIDKIKLKQKEKIQNELEQINSINIFQKEKDPLINQEIDSILIEQMPKKENKINSVDKFIILKKEKPKLIIEENTSILIPQKEKANLETNSLDSLILEEKPHPINEIQNIDKILLIKKERDKNIIEENTQIYIPPKEKSKLINEYIDTFYIESQPRKENIIQLLDKINLLEMNRPENKIQENDYLFIPKKERAINENQNVDSITIESKEKEENKIQILDKILLNEIEKEENIMQKTEDLFIQKEEKEPYEFQSVDNLLIEGLYDEETKKIQRIDQFTILKIFKLGNRIDKLDNIFIPRKEKTLLNTQTVNSIYIEGEIYQYNNNKIQQMDKINIIKKPKYENQIEKNDEFVLMSDKKAILIIQRLDQLMIEKEPKKELTSQIIDKIEIKEIKKEYNYIEVPNESISILNNKKAEDNKEVSVDNIFIDTLNKSNNEIENVEKMELLKTVKKTENKNVIETNDYIFIPPKEKEKLSPKLIESILIENNQHPENIAQIIDKIEIANIISPKQEIETKESLCILPEKRNPLLNIKNTDSILIEGINTEENKVPQLIDKIEIIEAKKPENQIELNETILIKSSQKEKSPLIKNKTEYILIEGNEFPENKIENKDKIQINLDKKFDKENIIINENEKINIPSIKKEKEIKIEDDLKKETIDIINLFEINRPENIIEENNNIIIEPMEKEELDKQKCDDLLIEAENKEENEIQKVEYIEILKTEKSFINEIELLDSINLSSLIRPPLLNENIDNIIFEEVPKTENEIESKEQFALLKSQKKKENNYLIEKDINILIKSKEKKIQIERQLVDNLLINGFDLPLNEIQKLETLDISPIKKESIQKIDESINIEIKSKKKEINNNEKNKKEFIDKIKIEESKRPENKIEKIYEIESKKDISKIKQYINETEKNCDFYIPSKEKYILEYEIMDRMLIEGLEIPINKMQRALDFTIVKSKIKKNLIPESDFNLFIKPKEKEPLEKQLTDSLYMEKIEKEENQIENSDSFIVIRKSKEENLIEVTCNLFIKSIEKKELELQNTDKLLIERLIPSFNEQKCLKENVNSFNLLKQQKPKIPINKVPLLENKIQRVKEIFIEPININEEYILELINRNNMDESKYNLHSKNKQKEIKPKQEFSKDRMDSLYFSGIEKQKEIKPKKEFIKDRMDSLFFSGIEKQKEKEKEDKDNIKQKNREFINLTVIKENYLLINREYNLQDKIKYEQPDYNEQPVYVQKEELSQEKMYLLFLEKWKKEKLKIQKSNIQLKIEGQKEKVIQIKKEQKKEGEQYKEINLSISKSDPLILEGNIKPEYFEELLLIQKRYLIHKEQIQPKSEINIHIPKIIKHLVKKEKSESNILINLIATKPQSLNLEGNINQEYFEELILLQKRYLTQKEQIKSISEIKIFIPKEIIIKKNQKIIQEYSDTKIQFYIKGKQKKPYIIENKGYFIINSTHGPSKNLIVRGTCFGFMAKPKKPGLVSQDFEIIYQDNNININWNLLNKFQRSQFFNIKGNDNKIIWNNLIKRQRCVKFKIPSSKLYEEFSLEHFNVIILGNNNIIEQEINNEDYNYISLEKGNNIKDNKQQQQQQKRVVKSTISKVIKEPKLDDSQEEFDPFSCCKKRETTKYDNLFKERKTVSVKMKENTDVNSNIILPGKKLVINIGKNKDEDEIRIKDNKERKSDINLIENKKKNKLKLVNKDNNQPNDNIFRRKEKKIEYLRESGTNNRFYN